MRAKTARKKKSAASDTQPDLTVEEWSAAEFAKGSPALSQAIGDFLAAFQAGLTVIGTAHGVKIETAITFKIVTP